VLPIQIVITLLAFITAGSILVTGSAPAIVAYHLIFAIGIIPLIFAAMMHFIPVLTRSVRASASVQRLPLLAMIGGGALILHLISPQTYVYGQYLGAILVILATFTLACWAWRRRKGAIGDAHPCLDWYLAALVCLIIAMAAILMIYMMPEYSRELRILHLHLNTLGFIGITAIATLQVLLPTVAYKADPESVMRLRKNLKWMIGGVLYCACAAALHKGIAWVALILFAIPLARIAKSWLRLYGSSIFKCHGAAPLLGSALLGFMFALVIGGLHGLGFLELQPIAAFITAFLMPLILGAVSHLLPIWVRPGVQTSWHQSFREWLGFCHGLRGLVLLLGGVLVSLGISAGWYLVLFAIVTFILQMVLLRWSDLLGQ
jgi:hypothetical protein